MQKIKIAQIEELVTARYQVDDPDVAHIKIRRGTAGWHCDRVRLYRDVPRLSREEIAAILADADKILAGLLQEHEVEDAGKTPAETAAQSDRRAAEVREPEDSRLAAESAKASRLRAQRLAKEAADREKAAARDSPAT